MFKHDEEDALIGMFLVVGAIIAIVYLILLLAAIIAGVAAAGGTLYGGGYAIKNYVSSFKENVIDSNRASAMTA